MKKMKRRRNGCFKKGDINKGDIMMCVVEIDDITLYIH